MTKRMILAELLEGESEKIVRAAIKEALAGNVGAQRLLIERLLPVGRGRPVRLDLPELRSVADLPQVQQRIVAEMQEGRITPEEALHIAGLIDFQIRSVEARDFELRLQALEDRAEEARRSR